MNKLKNANYIFLGIIGLLVIAIISVIYTI